MGLMSPSCIVCHSSETSSCFRTRDRHYGISGEFDIVKCVGCGLVRLEPVPTHAELAGYYSQDYYAYQPAKQENRLKKILKKQLKTRIDTHDPEFPQPGEFLDIGCGSGEYLHKFHAKGWEVRGVEPSAFGAQEGRRAGLNIFQGTLVEASLPTNAFDYVRSNHSFEHMPNPTEVLDEIYRILKPGGKLFIGIPNIDSLPFRIFGRYWWYLGAPVHTYNYTVSTISTLIEQAGLALDTVYYNSNYVSLLGSLQIYLNRNNGKKSTDGGIIRNPILMFVANIMTRIIDLLQKGDAIEVIAVKPKLEKSASPTIN